jgi:hypothetical protein
MIGQLYWNFSFHFREITVLIGLMTIGSVKSWFLIEDDMDFKIF